MAVAASPHAADGDDKRRRGPTPAGVVARLGFAAVAVLVVHVQNRQRASNADGGPAVSVSRRGQTTHVTASVAVASSSRRLWGVVRACLNGESVGVLRDVRHAEVLDRPAPGVCLLQQRVTWRAGLLRGENNMRARVHTNDAARSLSFVQLSDDPILRAYAGQLSVHCTGPESCVLHMQQQAEGQRSVIAHIAGSTVLGSTLRKQTHAMLSDFKRAAEAAP